MGNVTVRPTLRRVDDSDRLRALVALQREWIIKAGCRPGCPAIDGTCESCTCGRWGIIDDEDSQGAEIAAEALL